MTIVSKSVRLIYVFLPAVIVVKIRIFSVKYQFRETDAQLKISINCIVNYDVYERR